MENKPIKVLLIEDSVLATRLTQKMLAEAKSPQFNAELECADRLSAGLELIAKGGIDIVLLDLMLPDSHELDTFAKVHAHAPELPTIVISGIEDEALAIEALKKGAQDYLVKGQVNSSLLKRSILYAIERKRMEEALRDSEESLAEAQRIGQMGNWSLDLVNNKLKWSDEIYRIFGLELQQFGATYEAFLAVIHPDDREFVDTSYANSIRNKTPCDIIHRIVRPDGEVRWVHEKADDFQDETGKTVRSVGTVQDITERKQIEEELKEHQEHLEELVQKRTAELNKINKKLKKEITERKQAEKALQKAHDELEAKVAERTKELREKISELERFYNATVDRELRMKELRDKIRELESRLKENREK